MRTSLEPSLDPDAYPFCHPIRVRFAETDAMGIVHHSSYLLYLEEARVAYLRRLDRPYAALREEGIDLSVIEVFTSYRRPLRFDEVVDVSVDVGAMTAATFQLAYLLSVDGEARATAVTVHGAVNAGGWPVRLPKWMRELA